MGCNSWGHKESDVSGQLNHHLHHKNIGMMTKKVGTIIFLKKMKVVRKNRDVLSLCWQHPFLVRMVLRHKSEFSDI